MGNWHLAPQDEPRALTFESLRALRSGQPAGMSRRTLLRRSIGLGVTLWLAETVGGTLGFLWPNLAGGFGAELTLGSFDDVSKSSAVADAPFTKGGPAYFQAARSYVTLLDVGKQRFVTADSPQGDGASTNVRTLYQRCTHLGCKPNFCATNYWFECPCHGSRYDRLGIKVLGLGPAPRSLDRFASSVDAKGILTVDTGKITLGPLPVALGQPGVIPPKSPVGCL
jgi:cytochrome b6-f complex iron-sulfur subunit